MLPIVSSVRLWEGSISPLAATRGPRLDHAAGPHRQANDRAWRLQRAARRFLQHHPSAAMGPLPPVPVPYEKLSEEGASCTSLPRCGATARGLRHRLKDRHERLFVFASERRLSDWLSCGPAILLHLETYARVPRVSDLAGGIRQTNPPAAPEHLGRHLLALQFYHSMRPTARSHGPTLLASYW